MIMEFKRDGSETLRLELSDETKLSVEPLLPCMRAVVSALENAMVYFEEVHPWQFDDSITYCMQFWLDSSLVRISRGRWLSGDRKWTTDISVDNQTRVKFALGESWRRAEFQNMVDLAWFLRNYDRLVEQVDRWRPGQTFEDSIGADAMLVLQACSLGDGPVDPPVWLPTVVDGESEAEVRRRERMKMQREIDDMLKPLFSF